MRRTTIFLPSTMAFLAATVPAVAAGAQGAAGHATGAVSADSSLFAPLAIPPAPSATRLANGAPGPKYWQNRADYNLSATLDTVTGSVSGQMVLRYTNNSPDTLRALWFHTEQNGYRRGGTDDDPAHAYGDVIERFTQDVGGRAVAVRLEDRHQVRTQVILPAPLLPHQTATFRVRWHFVVPPHAFSMGREGSLYQIGQWYPRPVVYDDAEGWSSGGGTFDTEFGNFTLRVTVPADYIVAASGPLDNPSEVLTAAEAARLAAANRSDTVVHVVTAAELADGSAHLKKSGMVTWKFHTQNMRDMVWSASPRYLWDATSWHGIGAQAFYRVEKASGWSEVADMARMSIQEYSERWYPYPYAQITVAEGPVPGGQEYPAITFVGTFRDKYATYRIVTHEIGHSWFPMLAAANGEAHPWLHEGINTFVNTFSEARRYPERGDQTARGDRYRREVGIRIIKHTDLVIDQPWGVSADVQYTGYDKPAGVLQLLRRDVMGAERFDTGLRTYIRRWAYKHATPQDFFRTMDDAAGRDLSWFWREWFYETPGFDQGIDSVTQTAAAGDSVRVRVVYGNHARGVMPLFVHVTLDGGATQTFTYPAESWRGSGGRYVVTYTFPRRVTTIALDPDHYGIDTDRTDNVWPRSGKPAR